ncbi:MAG TPA: MBL fold metallo-hydrolase [Magnetospirillum sp.]|nr:MBL fold metallo-hydrolase [Magnetospirillum sp.]
MRVVVRDWLNANQVLFLGRENTLIDTGYGDCLAQTLTLLRAPGVLGERRLDRIVNTHGHSDHMGGNAALKRLYGCRISVPEGEAPLFAAWDTRALWLDYADQRAERFVHDDVIRAGEAIEMGGMHWQALAAPGHDMDALLFYCPEERLLIPGDALWANGFGVVMPSEAQARLAAARATLETIAGLDVRATIPGHGAPFTETNAALDRAFRRIEAFEADPDRMARNCVRVMLMYALLHRRRMALADLPAYVQRVEVHREYNELYFRLPPERFADMLVTDLEKAGAARRQDGWLVPA